MRWSVWPCLHGVTAVAELKPVKGRRGRRGHRSLHGVTAVAELKPKPEHHNAKERSESPRRHCRGRIEASPSSLSFKAVVSRHDVTAVAELWRQSALLAPPLEAWVSPRRHCRGRIEATASAITPVPLCQSPRRHCRGRIEARPF